MLYPTHTIDGRDLSPAERDAAPLLGRIDQPAGPDVAVERDFCHFEGWAVSGTSRPQVTISANDGPAEPVAITVSRPDVVQHLAATTHAISDPLCGFAYDVDLSSWPGGTTVEVVVELDDGKFRARSEPYRVSLPDDRALLGAYVGEAPSARVAVEIFRGEWSSKLPGELAAVSGTFDAFDDPRVRLAVDAVGGIDGARVLELGALEGGHTWMLEQMGADEIVAVEGNTRAFLRCLITKETVGLARSRFLCGDFVSYLREHPDERFDFVWASGVLYHVQEPLELLETIARSTDRLGLWTHYYDAAIIEDRPLLHARFDHTPEARSLLARSYELHTFHYGDERVDNAFCGGSRPTARWMTRDDLLACLSDLGFRHHEIPAECDERDHPFAPAILVSAWK